LKKEKNDWNARAGAIEKWKVRVPGILSSAQARPVAVADLRERSNRSFLFSIVLHQLAVY
jgi:hypothetical protein